jgi:serine/threonine protein kinase
LHAGVNLNEFEILKVIGIGGFGIVYLAYDHSLQRKIALKEYMPSSLAARSTTSHVTVKSERHAETFQAGMRSFINEARLLAQFDHPSLLKVYRFWEANGTAYMAMPFYEGLTLTQTLRGRGAPPDEAWLRSLLAPLLDALETIHVEQCFHRDISPDNIMMLADDRPLLLDFGAARRAIGGVAQAFTVILKPGYAPIEQYADVSSMQQGPWTDIYALASVVHFAITGHPPVPSVARMISDPQVPLAHSAAGRYGDAFLRVIDHALSVRPEDRPQSVAEMRSMLGLPSARQSQPPQAGQQQPKTAEPISRAVPAPDQRPGFATTRTILIGLVLVLAVAAVGFFLITRDNAPSAPTPDVQAEPKLPANEQAVAAPPAAKEKEVAVAKPVDPIEVLEQIFQARNRDHAVSVSVERSQVRIGKDRLHFSISSSKPGYVYLLMVGTDRSQFWLLFPNSIDKNNGISAAKPLALPRQSWRMDAAGPPGTDQLVVIVSESPRDFTIAGLKPNEPFAEFPLTAMLRPEPDSSGAAPIFAGKAKCAVGKKAACPESYGAAIFSIEEIPAL